MGLYRMLYGLFIDDLFPLSSITCLGSILGFTYSAIFVRFTEYRARAFKICAVFLIPLSLIAMYAVLAANGATGQSRASTGNVFGWLAVTTTFVFYSSPLAKIRTVLRTKSSVTIPVGMCVMAAINNALWLTYAALKHDQFLFIPNIICCALGIFQVVLYFVYRPTYQEALVNLQVLTIDIVVSPTKSVDIPYHFAESPTYTIMATPLEPIEPVALVLVEEANPV